MGQVLLPQEKWQEPHPLYQHPLQDGTRTTAEVSLTPVNPHLEPESVS